jgi:hypothetical protein
MASPKEPAPAAPTSQQWSETNPFKRRMGTADSASSTAIPTSVSHSHGPTSPPVPQRGTFSSGLVSASPWAVAADDPSYPQGFDYRTASIPPLGSSEISGQSRYGVQSEIPTDRFEIMRGLPSKSEMLREAEITPVQTTPIATFPSNPLMPQNPFSKRDGDNSTLKKSIPKQSVHEGSSRSKLTSQTNRQSLDVDAFKRLMLTGNAGLGGIGPAPSNETSSATSSISKQSLFEPIHGEQSSARSSRETLDDRAGEQKVETKKKKPLPPKPRHGKLLQAAGQNLGEEKSSLESLIEAPELSESPAGLGISDQERPLPALPHNSEGSESFPTLDTVDVTPDEPLPSPALQAKKTPPAPPMNRRQSIINRSKSSSSIVSTETPRRPSSISSAQGIPPMGSKTAPTPPAPRRRPSTSSVTSSIKYSTTDAATAPSPDPDTESIFEEATAEDDSSSIQETAISNAYLSPKQPSTESKRKSSVPPPRPPTRNPSTARRVTKAGNVVDSIKTTTISNSPTIALMSPSPSSAHPSQTGPIPPPPPRPRRASGGTMTNSGRSSIDETRRASVQSNTITEESEDEDDKAGSEKPEAHRKVPSISESRPTTAIPIPAEAQSHQSNPAASVTSEDDSRAGDILADLERLQKELDAYRGTVGN